MCGYSTGWADELRSRVASLARRTVVLLARAYLIRDFFQLSERNFR
jgi:hypothetical protein